MPLLKPAQNGTAFLKLGIQGFEGSGKTYLACDFARELTKLTKGTKVAFFDTEKGSDFYIDKFKNAGVEFFVVKSNAFIDLINTIKEAEKEGFSFLIIDSITHVWRELCAAYMKKKGRSQLTMKDWVYLKTEWQQFTHAYVSSKIHIAMCGRAGYEYDIDKDEDGKQEVTKSGTKMKAEGETGFEPDLLIETYKVHLAEVLTDRQQKKKAKGFINRCVVIKDRSDTINGKIFDRPKFKDFMPVIKHLNLGGDQVTSDTHNTSESLIQNSDRSWAERRKQTEIALEELKDLLVKIGLDGRSEETRKTRIELLEKYFGSSSSTKIENLSLEEIQLGIEGIKKQFNLVSYEPIQDITV